MLTNLSATILTTETPKNSHQNRHSIMVFKAPLRHQGTLRRRGVCLALDSSLKHPLYPYETYIASMKRVKRRSGLFWAPWTEHVQVEQETEEQQPGRAGNRNWEGKGGNLGRKKREKRGERRKRVGKGGNLISFLSALPAAVSDFPWLLALSCMPVLLLCHWSLLAFGIWRLAD